MVTPKTYTIWPGKVFTRGKTNHLSIEMKQRLVIEHNLAMVVCLRPEGDDSWSGIEGITYWHWPMADGKRIPLDLEDQARKIAKRLDAKPGAILIYCNAGRNRSVFFAALILRFMQNWSGATALSHVRWARPNCVANGAFADYLMALKA